MSKKRDRYSSEFKAEMALASLRNDETMGLAWHWIWRSLDHGQQLEALVGR